MKTPYHILLFPIQCHLIPYHWNDRGIPQSRQAIPSHQSCHWVSGVLFTKYENYFCRLQYLFIGLHLLWTGSSGFCQHFKLQVEVYSELSYNIYICETALLENHKKSVLSEYWVLALLMHLPQPTPVLLLQQHPQIVFCSYPSTHVSHQCQEESIIVWRS